VYVFLGLILSLDEPVHGSRYDQVINGNNIDLPAGSATFDINNHTFLDDMSDSVAS